MNRKKSRLLSTILLAVLLVITPMPQIAEAAQTVNTDHPDYYVWLANLSATAYKTFRSLSRPVYQDLSDNTLNQKFNLALSTSWSVFLNPKYRHISSSRIQQDIYETLLVDYLKYNVDKQDAEPELLNEAYFSGLQKLYGALADDLSNNTIDYIDSHMSMDKAMKIWKNAKVASNISTAMGYVGTAKTSIETFSDEVARYLAVMNACDFQIAFLKQAKSAAGKDKSFQNAVNSVCSALKLSKSEYIKKRTLKVSWDTLLGKAYDKLSKDNPILESMSIGKLSADILFDTTNTAANNLKSVLLGTMDNYMNTALYTASSDFQASKTSSNGQKFIYAFEGYLSFQMYGNSYAKKWFTSYIKDGAVTSAVRNLFAKKKIQTANDLISLCNSQIASRQTLMNSIDKASRNYQKKYPIKKGAKDVSPKRIKLSKSKATIKVGSKLTLKASVKPSNATKKTVIWTSSRPSVASVSKKGVVTGKSAGAATITAKTVNGKKATCKVIVKPRNSIRLNKSSVTLYTRGMTTVQLRAAVSGSSKKVTWKSSNRSVASVSSSGKVTAHKTGSAKITASANGVSASCRISVKKKKSRSTKDISYLCGKKSSVLTNKISGLTYTDRTDSRQYTLSDGSLWFDVNYDSDRVQVVGVRDNAKGYSIHGLKVGMTASEMESAVKKNGMECYNNVYGPIMAVGGIVYANFDYDRCYSLVLIYTGYSTIRETELFLNGQTDINYWPTIVDKLEYEILFG